MKFFVLLLLILLQRFAEGEICHCKANENEQSVSKTSTDCKCGCKAYDNDNCCEECCFHGDSNLTLEDGSVVKTKHVTVGQKVLTVENGKRIFTEVKTFMERFPNTNATHQTFTTEKGNHFSITEDHLIFMSNNNKTTDLRAEKAMLERLGDYIFSTLLCPSGLCAERVVDISFSEKPGLYVPLTDTGTLVVNGILVSNYAYFVHDVAQFGMTPFRWFPWLLKPWEQDGFSPILKLMKSLDVEFRSSYVYRILN